MDFFITNLLKPEVMTNMTPTIMKMSTLLLGAMTDRMAMKRVANLMFSQRLASEYAGIISQITFQILSQGDNKRLAEYILARYVNGANNNHRPMTSNGKHVDGQVTVGVVKASTVFDPHYKGAQSGKKAADQALKAKTSPSIQRAINSIAKERLAVKIPVTTVNLTPAVKIPVTFSKSTINHSKASSRVKILAEKAAEKAIKNAEVIVVPKASIIAAAEKEPVAPEAAVKAAQKAAVKAAPSAAPVASEAAASAAPEAAPVASEAVAEAEASKKPAKLEELLTLDRIVNYCMNDTSRYDAIKPVYDMLMEILYGNDDPKWAEARAQLKKRLQDVDARFIVVQQGAQFVVEQSVESYIANVSQGAIGVKKN